METSTAEKVDCQSAPAAKPYIGCKINLISGFDIRYEGTLHTVNGEDMTFTLSDVRSFGTEDRQVACRVEAPEKVYQYVVFKAKNVKDMFVTENSVRKDLCLDPAVLTFKALNMTPGNRMYGGSGGGGGGGGPASLDGSPQTGGQKRDMRRRMDDGGMGNGYYNNRSSMNPRVPKTGVFEANKSTVKSNNPAFTSDYDFIRANEVFKQKTAEEGDTAKENKTTPLTAASIEGDKFMDALTHLEPLAPAKTAAAATEKSQSSQYDKLKSFWDDISCETVEKSEGTYRPHDWQTERKVNQQTFGYSGLRHPFNARMGYRSRPMGMGGASSGGYMGNYNGRNSYRRLF